MLRSQRAVMCRFRGFTLWECCMRTAMECLWPLTSVGKAVSYIDSFAPEMRELKSSGAPGLGGVGGREGAQILT